VTPNKPKAAPTKAPLKKAAGAPGTRGGPSGVFTEDQMTAFLKARQDVPSSAPNYWQKVRRGRRRRRRRRR